MTTKRENILSRIIAVLAGTTGVGTRIYRSRVVPLTRNEFPALVVEPINDSAEQNTSLPTLDWSMQIRIAVLVRGSTTTSPDQAGDAIVESLHAKMAADLTLNGNAIDVIPTEVEFLAADADQPVGMISTNWIVRYRTELADLTQ